MNILLYFMSRKYMFVELNLRSHYLYLPLFIMIFTPVTHNLYSNILIDSSDNYHCRYCV